MHVLLYSLNSDSFDSVLPEGISHTPLGIEKLSDELRKKPDYVIIDGMAPRDRVYIVAIQSRQRGTPCIILGGEYTIEGVRHTETVEDLQKILAKAVE